MDEYNEEQSEIEKSEKQIEKVGKDAARVTKKALGEAAKKAFKALVHVLGKKAIIIAIAIIVLLLIIPLLWYGIENATYNGISEVVTSVTQNETGTSTGQVKEITSINGREIIIDTEEFEEQINDWFLRNNIDKNSLGISDDLRELKSFLEAEIATLYPDLRLRDQIGTEVPDGQIQGCVQFNRYYSDDTSELLEFMPYDEFSCEVAKLGAKIDEEELQEQIYFSKADVEAQYNALKDKFTIDEKNNLIIVGISSNETIVEYSQYAQEEGKVNGDGNSYTFNITIERINFQSVIEKYTMPFEFCLALLLVTDNNGFCEEIAQLAKDSEIIIDIQDNMTTTVIEDVYSYTSNIRVNKTVTYEAEKEEIKHAWYNPTTGQTEYDKETVRYSKTLTDNWEGAIEVEPYSIITYTSKTNQIQLCVSKVDTWIAYYESTYINDETQNISQTTSTDEDDAEYSVVQDYHGYSSNVSCDIPYGANVTSDNTVVKEKQTNKQINETLTITQNIYNKVSSEVEETPEKFLSLLKIDPDTGEFDLNNLSNNTELIKYETLNNGIISPENNLITAEVLLYELLASNSKTVNLEDTMRYLLDLYTGRTTVDTNRFAIYEPGEFIKVSTLSSLDKFKEYLHSFEGCTSLSADGTKYKIEEDGGGNLTVGHGIDIDANATILRNAGYSINEGDYIDKEFIDELEDDIIARNIERVESQTNGLNLTQYQIYALVSRMYNCGENGAFGVRNGKTFVEAYNEYWNIDNDLEYKVTVNESMFNHDLYTNYMSKPTTSNGQELSGLARRRRSEWILFKTGYFDTLGEYCSEFSGSAAAILESAENIHAYMEQNGYSYCLIGQEDNTHPGSCGLDNTFEESKTNHKLTCCATYVSWVLREAGYMDVTKHGALNLGNYLLSIGFYSVDYSEIEAGDIVIMTRNGGGHTQIYAGDGQWYNAGGVDSIQRAAPYASTIDTSKLTYVLRAP